MPASIVKDIPLELPEIGRIKIGERGRAKESAGGRTFQMPQKLDYFRVTTMERGPDGNFLTDAAVHKLLGERPKNIPVRLAHDRLELNFRCCYACYIGKSRWCWGDGEVAERRKGAATETVPCPCERREPDYAGSDKCKLNAVLSVIIDGLNYVGGVHKLRTTSWNSTRGILSSLDMIYSLTGGHVAGIPLDLTLTPKTGTDPSGRPVLIHVVGIRFRGAMHELQEIAYKAAQRRALYDARLKQVEERAIRMLEARPFEDDPTEEEEIVAEFYPEQLMENGNGHGEPVQKDAGEDRDHPVGPAEAPRESEGVSPGDPAGDGGERAPGNDEEGESLKRRRRRKSFELTPEENEVFKTQDGVLQTCGATPPQLLAIRAAAKADPEFHKTLAAFMRARVGEENLSFLRKDEAEELLREVPPAEAPTPTEPPQAEPSADAPSEMVDCPETGDRMKTSYCKENCATRKRMQWCPAVDAAPPEVPLTLEA